jgi:hypothetical protein
MNCAKTLLSLAIVFSVSLSLSSCYKEGDRGPQGPAGNANVKSVIFNVDSTAWQYSTGAAIFTRNTAEIMRSIYDAGSVMMYWQVSGNWVALPATYARDSTSQSLGFDYNVGVLRIYVINSNGSTPSRVGSGTFKAVITAGS